MKPLFRLRLYIVDKIKVNLNPHGKKNIYANHYAINAQYEGYRKITPLHMYKVDLPSRYKHWDNQILVLTVNIRKKCITVYSSEINVKFQRSKDHLGPIKYYSFRVDGYFLKHNSTNIQQTFSRFIFVNDYKFQLSIVYLNKLLYKTYFVKYGSLKERCFDENTITEIAINYKPDGQMEKIKIYDFNNPIRIYKS